MSLQAYPKDLRNYLGTHRIPKVFEVSRAAYHVLKYFNVLHCTDSCRVTHTIRIIGFDHWCSGGMRARSILGPVPVHC